MWFVDEGHIPTLDEAKARLEHLDTARQLPTSLIDWAHLEHVKLWQ